MIGAAQRIFEPGDQLVIERVSLLGTVQRDARNRAVKSILKEPLRYSLLASVTFEEFEQGAINLCNGFVLHPVPAVRNAEFAIGRIDEPI